MPRPLKISPAELAILVEKAVAGSKGLLLTDRELFHVMNRGRKMAERVCYRTFQRYKAATLAYGDIAIDEAGLFDPGYAELYESLMDNTIDQKLNLYERMQTAVGAELQSIKWTMERKFPDLNLRIQTQRAMKEYEAIDNCALNNDLFEIQAAMEAHKTTQETQETHEVLAAQVQMAIAKAEKANTLTPSTKNDAWVEYVYGNKDINASMPDSQPIVPPKSSGWQNGKGFQ